MIPFGSEEGDWTNFTLTDRGRSREAEKLNLGEELIREDCNLTDERRRQLVIPYDSVDCNKPIPTTVGNKDRTEEENSGVFPIPALSCRRLSFSN